MSEGGREGGREIEGGREGGRQRQGVGRESKTVTRGGGREGGRERVTEWVGVRVRAPVSERATNKERERESECVCVCVCVRVWEGGREGERERECVCVCVRSSACARSKCTSQQTRRR